MEKFKQLQKIKDLYSKGGNIIQYLRGLGASEKNSIEDILISYDFQSGTYIQNFVKNGDYLQNYTKALSAVMDNFPEINSIIEIGVGEATTLNLVLNQLSKKPEVAAGLDISWSRLKFAKELLNDFGHKNVKLFTANLFEIPLKDCSFDVVYTSHSLEPNGGREKEALEELYRITGKYLVLLEPAYELASEEAKARIKHHGYVTRLHETAVELGYKIVDYRLFDFSANPLNPTGILIIEKNSEIASDQKLVCPVSGSDLEVFSDTFLYSEESLLAYPVLEGIPCLLKENSILAAHLKTDYSDYKKENGINF